MKAADNTRNAQVRELTDQELDLVGGGTAATGDTAVSTTFGTAVSATSSTETPQIEIIAILIGLLVPAVQKVR
jgi:hypothetical protein